MILSGAEIIWECLIREGVEVVYGYPGGAILPTYDALSKYPQIHHVLARHEQGATHMADGYARASGKVGVAIATSGPGATNMVTGIATAMMDSSPIVCITGQVASARYRLRCVSGNRHHRRHAADHQAQFPRHRCARPGLHDPQGVPHRDVPGARGQCWSTSPRMRRMPRSSSCTGRSVKLPGYRPPMPATERADRASARTDHARPSVR